MKKIALIIAAAAALASCNFVQVSGKSNLKALKASDNIVTKTFEITDFNTLKCNIPASITFTQEAPASLEISTSDNIMEDLVVEQNGQILTLNFRSKWRNVPKLDIILSSSTISEMEVNGAIELVAGSGIRTDELRIEVNGASDMDIDGLAASKVSIDVNGASDCDIDGLDAGALEIDINGAGDCKISGKVETADVVINGAGNIDIRGLEAGNVHSRVNGVGTVRKN